MIVTGMTLRQHITKINGRIGTALRLSKLIVNYYLILYQTPF